MGRVDKVSGEGVSGESEGGGVSGFGLQYHCNQNQCW